MQNRVKATPLLLALGLALGVMATPISTAYAQTVVGNEAGEASIELGNTSDSTDQPAVASEADAPVENAASDPAEVIPPKDPREVYRDQVLKESAETQGATSAVSRRYKKVDKATYNQMLQSGALQPPQ